MTATARKLDEEQSNVPAQISTAVPQETRNEIRSLVDLAASANQLQIADNASYEDAAGFLSDIKSRGKELENRRKAITQPLDQAKKQTMAMFKPALDAINQCEQTIKQKMAAYYEEQERKRREAEAAAEEKARKERERLEARAEKAREKGQTEKAAALEDQAATHVATAPASSAAPPKATGTAVRTVWSAEVTDKMALIKAVAEGRASEALLDVNTSVANKLATALKENLQVDGLKAVSRTSIASR